MKVYIAGPISGIEDGNKEAFQKVEDYLVSLGYEVVNPHKLPQEHDMSWESFMRECIPEICGCQEMVMLKGWRDSRGARLEYLIGKELGLKIHESYADSEENK